MSTVTSTAAESSSLQTSDPVQPTANARDNSQSSEIAERKTQIERVTSNTSCRTDDVGAVEARASVKVEHANRRYLQLRRTETLDVSARDEGGNTTMTRTCYFYLDGVADAVGIRALGLHLVRSPNRWRILKPSSVRPCKLAQSLGAYGAWGLRGSCFSPSDNSDCGGSADQVAEDNSENDVFEDGRVAFAWDAPNKPLSRAQVSLLIALGGDPARTVTHAWGTLRSPGLATAEDDNLTLADLTTPLLVALQWPGTLRSAPALSSAVSASSASSSAVACASDPTATK